MLSLANIYTLYFRLYFRLCICLNKLSINNTNNNNKNNNNINNNDYTYFNNIIALININIYVY